MANPRLTKKELGILSIIVAATASEVGYGFVGEKDAAKLVKAGYIELNPQMTNEDGQIAARATYEGNQRMESESNTGEATAAPKSEFALDTDVPIPPIKRGGAGRQSAYPFDQMEVNQSFFVPDGDGEEGSAAKRMSSNVATVNRRNSKPSPDGETRTNRNGKEVPVMIPVKQFVSRAVEENGVKGARVWRVL